MSEIKKNIQQLTEYNNLVKLSQKYCKLKNEKKYCISFNDHFMLFNLILYTLKKSNFTDYEKRIYIKNIDKPILYIINYITTSENIDKLIKFFYEYITYVEIHKYILLFCVRLLRIKKFGEYKKIIFLFNDIDSYLNYKYSNGIVIYKYNIIIEYYIIIKEFDKVLLFIHKNGIFNNNMIYFTAEISKYIIKYNKSKYLGKRKSYD